MGLSSSQVWSMKFRENGERTGHDLRTSNSCGGNYFPKTQLQKECETVRILSDHLLVVLLLTDVEDLEGLLGALDTAHGHGSEGRA